MTKLYPNDPYSGEETMEEKKAKITIWEPLLTFTLWNDVPGILVYWLLMATIGWGIGLLVWGLVS